MLAWFDVDIHQPVDGKITPARGVIFFDIARDICELKGKAKVACAVEGFGIVFLHAHDGSHHHADRARDMKAIAHQIIFASGPPVCCI